MELKTLNLPHDPNLKEWIKIRVYGKAQSIHHNVTTQNLYMSLIVIMEVDLNANNTLNPKSNDWKRKLK